ncbi:hypothetical protein [Nitrospira sp. Nam74]
MLPLHDAQCTLIGCPSCAGVLSKIQDGDGVHVRYLCHVGHAFSLHDLLQAKEDQLEHALWSAISLLQHIEMIDEALLQHIDENGIPITKQGLLDRQEQVRAHLALVRKVIGETRPASLAANTADSDSEPA